MNKLLSHSKALILLTLAISLFQSGCKKETDPVDTDPLTKEEILTQKTWKVDRLHHVIGGTYSSYSNGGANTTGIPYEKLRFTFNSNGTGTHINETGNTYLITWQFTSPDKRTLLLTLNGSTSFTWEMLEIAGTYLHASVNLTVAGNSNNIETFRLIQIV